MRESDSIWSIIKKLFLAIFEEPNIQKNKASDIPNHLGYHKVKPKVVYSEIRVVEKTPPDNTISNIEIVVVIHMGKNYWSIFKCPCGCGETISLSLNPANRPSWSVRQSKQGRPTLYPSVWQSKGCCSHFWIDDGRVYWCSDSGILPWVAKPQMYSKPNSH